MVHCLTILVSGPTRVGERVRRTLSGVALALVLVACGQQGPLYLPTDAAAANRATLPQTLLPKLTPTPAPDATAAPPAQPASQPASR